ncbi:MAG: hypothetical protein M1819_003533 [Sarea resinae]|nr:MAG: hypothetical protein M1819_003533 [Sarea resinae]
MALVKTYLLAPNFNFRPDGPIALGNIIANPFRPQRILTAPGPSAPRPEIESITEYDYQISRGSGRDVQLGVWATFLQTVGGNVGLKNSHDLLTEFTMDSMETRYLKHEPSEQEISERVRAPRVRNVITSGTFRSQPVYMITGVKIAKGLRTSKERSSNRGGDVGATVPVSAEVSVGAGIDLSTRKSERDAFRAGDDVVFAYQLMKITEKGWREKNLVVDDYYPKAAYLSEDFEEEKDEDEVMVACPLTVADLREIDGEEVAVRGLESQDADGECLCIAPEDA